MTNPAVTPLDARGYADVVRLQVPAALEFVRLVRLTTSGFASRLGLDVEEIEDLRIAVDELASAVVDAARAGSLDVTLAMEGDQLVIEGEAPVRHEPVIEPIGLDILRAVADQFSVSAENGLGRFRCVKRIRPTES